MPVLQADNRGAPWHCLGALPRTKTRALPKQHSRPDSVDTRWLPAVISSTPLRIHTHGRSLERSHRSLPSPARFLYNTRCRYNIPPSTHCPLSSLSMPAVSLRWFYLPPAAASYDHQVPFCGRLRSVRGIPRVNFLLLFPLGDASLNRSVRCGKHLVLNGGIHAQNPSKTH